MKRHPVTQRIDEAVELRVEWERPVTPGAIREYVKNNLRHADFTSDEAMEAVIDRYLVPRLKSLGYIIATEEEGAERERKLMDDCTVSEFSKQVEIKQRNVENVRNRFKADRAVEEFLLQKQEMAGRDLTVGEFADAVTSIYAEHGIAA
jgi:hypothetical protein